MVDYSVCLAGPETIAVERNCLLLALLLQDVPLISLANIFHNARLWNDAIIVATMAVEIAPHFVVNHFTLANVYVAMVSVLPPRYGCLWDTVYICREVFILTNNFEGATFKKLGCDHHEGVSLERQNFFILLLFLI